MSATASSSTAPERPAVPLSRRELRMGAQNVALRAATTDAVAERHAIAATPGVRQLVPSAEPAIAASTPDPHDDAVRLEIPGAYVAEPISPAVEQAPEPAVAVDAPTATASEHPVRTEPVRLVFDAGRADVIEDAEPSGAEEPTAFEMPAAADAGQSAASDDVDPFLAAAEAFGFDAETQTDPAADARAEATIADESAETWQHRTPRRGRVMRRMVAAGASLGVMGVAGLLAVSMTLPVEAVAGVRGDAASAAASLTAAGSTAGEDEEIQAYVASSDVENETLQRAEDYSSVSLGDLAAEAGIEYSNSLYTNDTDAAIQWPYAVGVAMSSPYGQRWGRLHAGLDLVPGDGAPIQAIAGGVVRTATESGGGFGVTVYIDHMIDGKLITSHYSHMQYGSLRVKNGDTVKAGDVIGLTGNTGRSYGSHLHFQLLVDGSTIDPLPWLRKNAGRYDGVGPVS